MSSEDVLKTALENAVARERTARRRSIIYTAIPVIMALALIWFTWWQVSVATRKLNATKELLRISTSELSRTQDQYDALQVQLEEAEQKIAELQGQSKDYQKEIETLSTNVGNYKKEIEQLQLERDGLQSAIDELAAQVEQAQGLKRFIYNGDLNLVLKSMLDEQAFDLLLDIGTTQEGGKTEWHPGGVGPSQFDSPGFAVYMLEKHDLISGDPEKIHYSLINTLHPTTTPTDGDLVFYEGGYTMFYFYDTEEARPFVIGMTPLGIVAMDYDFAPIRMIGDVTSP